MFLVIKSCIVFECFCKNFGMVREIFFFWVCIRYFGNRLDEIKDEVLLD